MGFLSILLIAVGLSMDAFACAIAKGVTQKRFNIKNAVIIAVFFGGFQGLMPLLGWLLGAQFAAFIEPVDHWVAFGLLAFIGGKMIYDQIKESRETKAANTQSETEGSSPISQAETESDADKLDLKEVLLLAIATSIDALAVGVSFAFLGVDILFSVLVIGVTTFVFSLAGVAIGYAFGSRFERIAGYIGGIVLLIIGIDILIDHLAPF